MEVALAHQVECVEDWVLNQHDSAGRLKHIFYISMLAARYEPKVREFDVHFILLMLDHILENLRVIEHEHEKQTPLCTFP